MVRLLGASAVVMAMLGWAAGAAFGDPLTARHPLPRPNPQVAAGCHFVPQLEVLPRFDRVQLDPVEERGQELELRRRLGPLTKDLSDCAGLYAEPGAEQLARVTVAHTGEVRNVVVQGRLVAGVLTECVERKLARWSFQPGPHDFVLTLPVQYCPES